MIETVNSFSLAGDKFMPQMHFRYPTSLYKLWSTYSACGPFLNIKERIQKLKKNQEIHDIFIKIN